MNTTTKIINIATSSIGKTYQRTTKRGHFTFALIITSPSGKGVASFHDTEAEAIAKKETYLFYFDRNMSFLKPHDRVALADMRIEIVPVIQTSEAKAHFVLNEYPGLSEALLRALGGSSEEKTAARNA